MTRKGIKIITSSHTAKETIDKIQALLLMNGATIYARINQQEELKKAGLHILPLEFILFGNPAVGGKLMIENPVVALDLPLKIISWEDANQQVWIAFNEAGYIQERYSLATDIIAPLQLDKLITKALNIPI